jgi:polysaccharide export outer membrane protein
MLPDLTDVQPLALVDYEASFPAIRALFQALLRCRPFAICVARRFLVALLLLPTIRQSHGQSQAPALSTSGLSVLVTERAGSDISVLGEVTHPGVYPFAVHHRLLDVIAAASGLAPTAGGLVTITHRTDAQSALVVLLNPVAENATAQRNPELEPGDTVEISRAGLIYVSGDVLRPGSFPLNTAQRPTVVQALALAGGPTPDAAMTKALLIREQQGGRTITILNLKRLLRGQDLDPTIQDRDILFVPDSAAKSLWDRTIKR